MTGGSAEKQTGEQAKAAVLDVLAPICVETFNQDSDREEKLVALKKENSWQHDAFVTKQGAHLVAGYRRTGPVVTLMLVFHEAI